MLCRAYTYRTPIAFSCFLRLGLRSPDRQTVRTRLRRCCRCALFGPHGPYRQRLLSAFGDFFAALSPDADAKLLCVKFICKLTMALLSGSASTADAEAVREVRRWLQSFPELLCQWGGNFPETSATMLQVLVEVAKRSPAPPSAGVPAAATGAGPADGKSNSGRATVRMGAGAEAWAWAVESTELLRSMRPGLLGNFFSERGFLSLPVSAQTDAVSLLYHLPSLPACVISALATACSDPTAVDGDVRSFVLEVSGCVDRGNICNDQDLVLRVACPPYAAQCGYPSGS